MKLRVLGCSGNQIPGHDLSAFLVNDSLLVDAGSATSVLGLRAQQKVKNIPITHVHLDHVMGLATIADNLYGNCESTINVWGINNVISGLSRRYSTTPSGPILPRSPAIAKTGTGPS